MQAKPNQQQKSVVIFGAGISGITLARLFAEQNYQVTIYEKNNFIGGNCHDYYNEHKILVHQFGPHIFHTSNQRVYRFIRRFTKLNKFVNRVLIPLNKHVYFPLPINFDSIKIIMREKADGIIAVLKATFKKQKTITLFDLKKIKDADVQKFAKWIWNNVYANYTAKMWAIPLDKIDHNVINRVKIILSHERNYFPDDKYQGLPVDGYTAMFKKMLDHPNITVQLKANAEKIMQLKNHKIYIKRKLFKGQVFYSGTVDQLFNYKMGRLTFRSLHFAFHTYFYQSFQPTANVNYPADPKMTRICEYKKMTFQKAKVTTISKEYPGAYKSNSKQFNVPYYPINNQTNNAVLQRYTENVKKYPQLHMIGRLGQYKYYDMDDAIEAAMCLFDQIQTN